MRPDQYEHLHSHLQSIEERLVGLDAELSHLARLEIITSLKELSTMGKQSDEISKLGTRFDNLSSVVTDIHSDFEALRAVMTAERENLSEAGQAAVDAANAKADQVAQQLTDLDVEVGDADGSDIPTGGDSSTPAEPAPSTPAPGGEATVPGDGSAPAGDGSATGSADSDVQPTA